MKKVLIPTYLLYRPAHRHLIVASTGGGKTTLSSHVLRNTHFCYPDLRIAIIDPNDAYLAAGHDTKSRELFPDGIEEHIYGDSKHTLVNADEYSGPDKSDVFVIHDMVQAEEFYTWCMAHGSALRPILVVFDETLDAHTLGGKLILPVRNILQKGRRKGIGTVLITQRSNRIDQTMISETDIVYVGRLNNNRDQERIVETLAVPSDCRIRVNGRIQTIDDKLPKYTFLYVDQADDSKVEVFHLNLKGKKNGKIRA